MERVENQWNRREELSSAVSNSDIRIFEVPPGADSAKMVVQIQRTL